MVHWGFKKITYIKWDISLSAIKRNKHISGKGSLYLQYIEASNMTSVCRIDSGKKVFKNPNFQT